MPNAGNNREFRVRTTSKKWFTVISMKMCFHTLIIPSLYGYDFCSSFSPFVLAGAILFWLLFTTMIQTPLQQNQLLTGLVWQTQHIWSLSTFLFSLWFCPIPWTNTGLYASTYKLLLYFSAIAKPAFHQRKTHLRCYLPISLWYQLLAIILTFKQVFNG